MFSHIILAGLLILIIFAPIAVGSVYIVTYSAMELLIYSLLALHLWTADFAHLNAQLSGSSSVNSTPNTQHSTRSSYLRRTLLLMSPIFLFHIFCLFQMLPLPFYFLEKLSPQTAALYMRLGLPLGFTPLAQSSLPLTLSLSVTNAAMLKWLAYTAVFFLAATFVPPNADEGWIDWLFMAVFVIGFAEAVYGLYLYLNQSEYLLWFKRMYQRGGVAGTYINYNHFVGLMNMCIPASVALFASRIGFRSKTRYFQRATVDRVTIAASPNALFLYFLLLGLTVMVLAVIFSLSRMGQFSLIAAITLFAVPYLLSTARRPPRALVLPVVLLAVLSLGLLWGAWKGLDPVEDRWQTLKVSYEDRFLIWSSTSRLIRNFPLTGTGLGTYELAYAPYKPQRYGALIVDHAHNDYLELISEVGVAGFAPWLAFYLSFFLFTMHAWFKRRNHFSRFLGAGGLVAATAMLVHSLADFNLQIPANAMLLFLIMGLTWRVVNCPAQEREAMRRDVICK